MRHDRVEHELRDVVGMRERVALADVGAVRDAVDDPSCRRPAPGAASRCRRRRRRCRRTAGGRRSSPRTPGPLRPSAGRGPRCPLLLQRRAVERTGARAALVEHHDPVGALFSGDDSVDEPVEDRQARLARPAGQHEQHAPRRLDVVGGRDTAGASVPFRRSAAVERNVERRARVAGDAGRTARGRAVPVHSCAGAGQTPGRGAARPRF